MLSELRPNLPVNGNEVGPVKAVAQRPDPMRAGHPMRVSGQRCGGHSKQTGKPCKYPAIPGGTVCRFHGGAAPQVIAAAAARLEALRTPAIAYLGYLLAQREFPSAGLGAAKDVLDRVDGKAAETVRVIETTDAKLAELKEAQRQNAMLARRKQTS